jgi:hypothetical protein
MHQCAQMRWNKKTKQWLLAKWLIERPSSYGMKMFIRIYQANNGNVELYVATAHFKDAIDWARLSTSKIAKNAIEESLKGLFFDKADTRGKRENQPDWTPHTLGKRVELLATPTIPLQYRRRGSVAMKYKAENTTSYNKSKANKDKATTTKTTDEKQQGEKMLTQGLGTKTQETNTWGPPRQEANMMTPDQKETNGTNTNNIPKFGAIKYKVAASAQTKRINNLEECISKMVGMQERTHEKISLVVKSNEETNKEVRKLAITVNKNKKEDKKEKKEILYMILAFQESLAVAD